VPLKIHSIGHFRIDLKHGVQRYFTYAKTLRIPYRPLGESQRNSQGYQKEVTAEVFPALFCLALFVQSGPQNQDLFQKSMRTATEMLKFFWPANSKANQFVPYKLMDFFQQHAVQDPFQMRTVLKIAQTLEHEALLETVPVPGKPHHLFVRKINSKKGAWSRL
jgi:hypothetical protein